MYDEGYFETARRRLTKAPKGPQAKPERKRRAKLDMTVRAEPERVEK